MKSEVGNGTKNLWGQDFKSEPIRTPSLILREQAAFVGKLTEYLLEGSVEMRRTGDFITLDLSIIASVLDNYVYTVLSVSHNIHRLYPLEVSDRQPYTSKTCENEEEFLEALASILSGDQVKRVINNLLSQIKAEP